MIRLAALMIALFAGPVFAQEVLGTAVIGGKRVELLSDNTWRYFDADRATEAGCVAIDNRLSFCGSILNWRPLPTAGTEFIRQFRHSDRVYAGIIHEGLGANDGMDADFMRNAIIENVASFTGARPQDIPIHNVTETEVDGQPAESITYGAKFEGLDIIYQNTLVNGPDFNLQFVVWSIGSEVTDEAREMNDNFLRSVRINTEG